MSTNTSFSAMLNQYLPNSLLFEDIKRRNWLFSNCDHDDTWLGGTLIVPFNSAVSSTITFGSLAAATDIAEEVNVRGTISGYKEAWGTLLFQGTDLMQHGKISEQNLLRILPDAIDRHMDYFQNVLSQNILTGNAVAKASASGDSSGNITVAQPDRFMINMKVQVADDDTTAVTGYIKTINMNSGVLNLVTVRGGATPVDLSSYTVAQNAKVYNDGQQANGFSSLRSMLLSLANGGDTNIYGVAKTASPYTQAINVDGSDITSANILSKVFDAYVTIKRLGKGMPKKVLMSYKNLGNCLKALEDTKGAFNVVQMSKKTQVYGWEEVTIGGSFGGAVTLVAIQEMDDDVIYFMDMRACKLYSNGGFRKNKSPEGLEYFTVRATTGYQYLVDTIFFGDFVLERPSYCGVLAAINYT